MGNQHRILLAEQEHIAGAYMQRMMEKNGWHVDLVSNGALVLEKIPSESYDAVVISSSLPDMDGVEVARQVHTLTANSSKPVSVIGMANYSLAMERKKFKQVGVEHCLTKPVYQKQLVNTLKQAFKSSKGNVSMA